MLAYQDRITSAISGNSIVHEHVRIMRNREDGFLVVCKVKEDDEEYVRKEFIDVVRGFARDEPVTAVAQRMLANGYAYLAVLFNQREEEG